MSRLAWLDVSAEQQRRVRDIIRMFEEPGTRDELGIGPIRDSFSDLLFPGTSTQMTRVRYFLFVPWAFQVAAARGKRGQALLDVAEKQERRLIDQFQNAGWVDGLIGRLAGARVKYLPSTVYWGGLERWGVLTSSMSPRAAAELMGTASVAEAEELEIRAASAWHPTLPAPPAGFPGDGTGGFQLTEDEASWLRERIFDRAAGTLLAQLVSGPRLSQAEAPWLEPAAAAAPADARSILEHGRRFSLLALGPALLYNLLVGERYVAKGFTRIDDPVGAYRRAIDDWAERLDTELGGGWDWEEFWMAVSHGGHRVPPLSKQFLERWWDCLASSGPGNIAADQRARDLVRGRVERLRGSKAVLVNDKLLAGWGGASGTSPLTYRWSTVHRLVSDIQEGLAGAGA